jgi:endonuclease/exonuclease/phosphatase family metal-dependent hydrolase
MWRGALVTALTIILLMPAVMTTSAQEPQTIKVASWNIQNFGKSKAQDDEVMNAIAGLMNDYDIIAVQEVSNVKEKSDSGCPRNEGACPGPECGLLQNVLEKYLNEDLGRNYKFEFSPHVKDERYLYIYNPDRVTLESAALVDDPGESKPFCENKQAKTGKMIRQPFKAKFKAGDFDFVLLTAHTSPQKNVQELNGLAYLHKKVEKEGERDVIILGDLNADCTYLTKAKKAKIALAKPGYIWKIDDASDTTVASTNCAYDRFIFKGATSEDFVQAGINKNVTEKMSDHYLVWAEFRTDRDSD